MKRLRLPWTARSSTVMKDWETIVKGNHHLTFVGHCVGLCWGPTRSPLQQMSSSKLFEIAKKPQCGVFSVMSRSQYMVSRKACIQAIMATDTALHFQNVKKVGTAVFGDFCGSSEWGR